MDLAGNSEAISTTNLSDAQASPKTITPKKEIIITDNEAKFKFFKILLSFKSWFDSNMTI